MTEALTLPDHERCDTHEGYLLSCAQYEGLLTESGRRCQICGFPADQMPLRKLFIDHDSLEGHWAVRGLLCISCNSQLQNANVFRPEVEDYLGNAWYLRELRDHGVLASRLPEPPVGSVVRDGFKVDWLHEPGGRWKPCGGSFHGNLARREWYKLRHRGGPHKIQIINWGPTSVSVPVDDAAAAASELRAHMPAPVREELARLLLE